MVKVHQTMTEEYGKLVTTTSKKKGRSAEDWTREVTSDMEER